MIAKVAATTTGMFAGSSLASPVQGAFARRGCTANSDRSRSALVQPTLVSPYEAIGNWGMADRLGSQARSFSRSRLENVGNIRKEVEDGPDH